MMQKANLLVLDEPTNHLDLDSKEVLENALIDYPGTLVFVSHDRYFINRIATKVVELSGKGSFEYLGDYDYFVEKKEELEELSQIKAAALAKARNEVAPSSKMTTSTIDKDAKKRERQIRRALDEIEAKMGALDETIAKLETQLCDPDVFSNHEKAFTIQTELDTAKASHEEVEMEWLELSEELEAMN